MPVHTSSESLKELEDPERESIDLYDKFIQNITNTGSWELHE